MRRWVVVTTTTALVVPIAAWTVAQSRQLPGYSPIRQTISALAANGARESWIMTVGLLTLGLCHLGTAIGLDEVGLPGRFTLGLGGAATVAVAALPQPAYGHLVAAGIAFVALAIWPLFSAVPEGGSRILATATLLAILLWFGMQLDGGQSLGLSERILATAQALWPLLIAARLLASAPAAAQPAEATATVELRS